MDSGTDPSDSDRRHGGEGGAIFREQDRLLPIANVGRIMKEILPPNAKISKEAKETMQECVSEFIGFVTGEASDKCRRERRKTVNGDDVCWALGTLGFDDYSSSLRRYLQRYRDLEGEKAAATATASSTNAGEEAVGIMMMTQQHRTGGSLLQYGAQHQQQQGRPDHHVHGASSSSGMLRFSTDDVG